MPNPIRRKPLVRIGNLPKAEMLGLIERGGFQVDRLTFERVMGKSDFDMRVHGEIVPFSSIVAQIGADKHLHYIAGNLRRFRVGNWVYVTAAEANRFQGDLINRKRQLGLEKKRRRDRERRQVIRAGRASFEKRPVAERARKTKAKQADETKAAERKQGAETKRLIDAWMKKASKMKPGRRRLMESVLSRSANLSPKEFREHVLPSLAKLMERY